MQDDFGGTVQTYHPKPEEIAFAEKTVEACDDVPVYARVDLMWDNQHRLVLSELEIVEPELWLRFHPAAAEDFADGILAAIKPG